MIKVNEEQQAKWDKSGLKEACLRARAMGRVHQTVDIQLLLDMLLEIERLEVAVTSPSLSTEAVARECAAQIANMLNTQYPAIEWPFLTIASIIQPYLAGRESEQRAWNRAIAIVKGLTRRLLSHGCRIRETD